MGCNKKGNTDYIKFLNQNSWLALINFGAKIPAAQIIFGQ